MPCMPRHCILGSILSANCIQLKQNCLMQLSWGAGARSRVLPTGCEFKLQQSQKFAGRLLCPGASAPSTAAEVCNRYPK